MKQGEETRQDETTKPSAVTLTTDARMVSAARTLSICPTRTKAKLLGQVQGLQFNYHWLGLGRLTHTIAFSYSLDHGPALILQQVCTLVHRWAVPVSSGPVGTFKWPCKANTVLRRRSAALGRHLCALCILQRPFEVLPLPSLDSASWLQLDFSY